MDVVEPPNAAMLRAGVVAVQQSQRCQLRHIRALRQPTDVYVVRSPKRGWAQYENGSWYTANITNDLGKSGAFNVKFDDKDELTGVPRDRVLRDGDRVFVSWDDAVLCLGFRCGSKAAASENGCADRWVSWTTRSSASRRLSC